MAIQVNPYAIPASILMIFIVLIALIGGFAKIILTLLWPSGSSIWAYFAGLPMVGMRHVVAWLATLPGAQIPLPKPPIWVVLVYYGLLLTMLIRWPRWWLAWPAKVLAGCACAILALLPLREGFVRAAADARDLKVTLLAIGAGQTCVVEPPNADAVLVDAGSDTMSDVFGKALGPFLRHEGRRNIRSIFISHPNYDHFSAVTDIVQAYDVSAVYIPPEFRAQSVGNTPAEHMLQTLDAMDRPPRQIKAGDHLDLSNDVKLDVLWPPPDCPFDDNNCGEVMRLSFAGKTILFTADIQVPAEKQLLKAPQNLKADVMVAPHHGSFETSTVAFVNAVSPGVIICSNDRKLSGKQHDFDRAMRGRIVYRTNSSGAITIRISPDGKISIETFLH